MRNILVYGICALPDLSNRLAQRLKRLRLESHMSLDQLAEKSGVSRASLSRLEKADVSPTAEVLGKLCAAYGLPMSRLLAMVEEEFTPLVDADAQEVWHDEDNAFVRKSVSPPTQALGGEVIECRLGAGQSISYDKPPRANMEHHVVLRAGRLNIEVNGQKYALNPGDCLRYQLSGRSKFSTPSDSAASYFIFLV